MNEIIRPIPPWRRVPAEWQCAECLAPATGVLFKPGLVIFYCEAHHDALSDWLLETLDFGGCSGWTRLRDPWRHWLGNFGERLWRRLVRSARPIRHRQRKAEAAAQEALLREIFAPSEYEGVVARTERIGRAGVMAYELPDGRWRALIPLGNGRRASKVDESREVVEQWARNYAAAMPDDHVIPAREGSPVSPRPL